MVEQGLGKFSVGHIWPHRCTRTQPTQSPTDCLGLLLFIMAEFCSYSRNHMAHKAYNLYSLALCKKSLLTPSSRKLDCLCQKYLGGF